MTIPTITLVQLAGAATRPLLVVGPSLGTSVTALWGECASQLGDAFHVVGWELPGHGHGAPATEPFTIAELAAGVLAAVLEPTFIYAGDSVGGAVGLELALAAPARVTALAAICTGARIGEPAGWRERAASVRASGTPAVVAASAQRWFAPGFLDRAPEVGAALLHSLQDADRQSYALVCEALAEFDVRERLGSIPVPVLAIAGSHDHPTPPTGLRELAAGVPHGSFVELGGVAHLAPAEAPALVAALLRGLVPASGLAAGLAVRRAVLGDAHVDRASRASTEVTHDFQQFITEYAWGSIWTRPGLTRRDRSIAVLTALIAGRHFDELEFHLRAAVRNGLTRAEIVEVLLQSAVYVGVPAANSAFAVANRVLTEPLTEPLDEARDGARDRVPDGARDGAPDGARDGEGEG